MWAGKEVRRLDVWEWRPRLMLPEEGRDQRCRMKEASAVSRVKGRVAVRQTALLVAGATRGSAQT